MFALVNVENNILVLLRVNIRFLVFRLFKL